MACAATTLPRLCCPEKGDLHLLANFPQQQRDDKPGERREDDDAPCFVSRDERCNEHGEHEKSDAANSRASRIDAGRFSGPYLAMQTGFLFPLLLVLFDQRCACRKNRGEREEQTANRRAKFLCDEARGSRCQSSANESDRHLAPVGLL